MAISTTSFRNADSYTDEWFNEEGKAFATYCRVFLQIQTFRYDLKSIRKIETTVDK